MLGEACKLLNVRLEDVISGALELNKPSMDISSSADTIGYINSLIQGRSPEVIGTIAEVVESIIKMDKG